jgi:hypothetical protein
MDKSIVPSKNSIRGSCALAILFDSATLRRSPTLVSIGGDGFISALATSFASGIAMLLLAAAAKITLAPIMSKHKKAFAMALLVALVSIMKLLLKIAFLGIREHFFTNPN